MHFQLNNNGDSYETLSKQLAVCQSQASALRDALTIAWPHGRNYQTIEGDDCLYADHDLFVNMAATVAHFEAEIEQARVRLFKQKG